MKSFDHTDEPEKFCECTHSWNKDIDGRCIVYPDSPSTCRRHFGCEGRGKVIVDYSQSPISPEDYCERCQVFKWSFEER